MAYAAKIVLDSVTKAGDRLTTMEATFPRMVLAEFNTHRAFSRNSASSRAIPFKKQLERIRKDPFVPVHWGANQAGMQAHEEISPRRQKIARFTWLLLCRIVMLFARFLNWLGLHKQVVNRLLEPFMWHTVVVTATEWSNFFALRANPDAQPEIRVIAEMMKELYEASTPTLIQKDDWHLPFIQPEERNGLFEYTENARKISAARCARVSYLTHDGKRDIEADLKLYERLVKGGHMSPLEHVATPNCVHQLEPTESAPGGRKQGMMQWVGSWDGNFYGWQQLRKLILNEHDFSLAGKG